MLAFLDRIPLGTHRLRRIAFWLLTAFAAYVLLGFLAFPPLIESLVEKEATKALNRTTSIERVTFNPLNLHFEVHGLKVHKREGEGDLFSVGVFSASPGLSSIWKLAPVISHLHLRDLVLDITFFGDGKYSISDLIGARKGQPATRENRGQDADVVFPFALYGFEMTNSTLIFDDRPHDKRHVISDLNLLIPFTSSFLNLRKEYTEPKFTAVVNGDPIDLKGRTLPFDESLLTEFELGAVDVDLHQYWRYLPIETPLSLVSGRFTSDISLFFERPNAERVNLFLGGGGKLLDLQLAAPNDDTVVALKELNFEMKRFSLGDNELVLSKVLLDEPYFKIIRRRNDAINWAGYFPGRKANVEGEGDKAAPLQLELMDVEVRSGQLDWQDQAVEGGYKHIFKGFTFRGRNISTSGDERSTFEASFGDKGRFTASGTATIEPLAGNATVAATDISLLDFKPYLTETLPVLVDSGQLSGTAIIDFDGSGDETDIDVRDGAIELAGLSLRKPEAKKPSLTLDRLSVAGARVDLKEQAVNVARVTLNKPDATLVRERSGDIDLVALFDSDEAQTAAEEPEAEKPGPGWTATLGTIRIADGAVAFRDASLKTPATLGLKGIDLTVKNLTTRQDAELTYAMTARPGTRGNLNLEGTANLTPLAAKGRLKLAGMGLRPLDGYLGEFSELLFASGSASANLAYTFTGGEEPEFSVWGDTLLSAIQLKDNKGDGELAGLESLTFDNLRLQNAPYRLAIDEIKLKGPRASINFDEKGRLNIRRALRIPEPEPAPEGKETQDTDTQQTKAAPPAQPAEPEPSFFDSVTIGRITMEEGTVRYRDASVTPVFATELSNMRLTLNDISQQQDARPKVDFSANIGPTTITTNGVLNPVVSPIYSDLAISVGGLEMIQLTPYTIKYLAYPVEKGRLYADVQFRTENNELNADNKFLVEQLELGPKDTRPDAPNVPVKFGLALLQDSSGNLELDLPIRGNLDDPNFKIGGIVFRAIANMFIGALTSPFSIIGSIFGGGGQDLDHVIFKPGRHDLDQGAKAKLESTVKALQSRDRLKLEVDGVVDPVADTNGLMEVLFENKLKQQKYDDLSRKERAQTTVEAMTILPGEYEDLLYEAYADEPDEEGIKPTTLFVTDRMPPEFMRKFIMDRIQITQKDLDELAVQRATTVKRHITEQNPALTDRVFLLDRKKNASGKTGVPKHRVDLGLRR